MWRKTTGSLKTHNWRYEDTSYFLPYFVSVYLPACTWWRQCISAEDWPCLWFTYSYIPFKSFHEYKKIIRKNKQDWEGQASCFWSHDDLGQKRVINLQKVLFIGKLVCVGQCWATPDTTRTREKELAKATGSAPCGRYISEKQTGRIMTFSDNKM